MSTRLGDMLGQHIRASGPISVAEFMATCLGHPQWGYYIGKDPLGAAGDFVTSPEISQMFGELIGLWAAAVWQSMGEPRQVVLAELGPGRGTLMADFLRAARQLPAFRRAIKLHLVETSPTLRLRQQHALGDADPVWVERIDELPSGPLIVIANEFFDALPVHQYVKSDDGWHERLVGFEAGEFAFIEGPPVALSAPPARRGEIFEVCPSARHIAGWLGQRVTAEGGAALIIDYGHAVSAPGDTLQAVSRHQTVSVFHRPGESDLTAHVDFQAMAESAHPAKATKVTTQGAFLRSLGIELRADRLIAGSPDKGEEIAGACRRLIDAAGMGTLFKVMGLIDPRLPLPPGLTS